jgi:type IV secretion system protein VirB4
MNETALNALLSTTAAIKFIATGIGAVGAAAAMGFAIPSIVDWMRPFPRQDTIADFLPFERMLPNRRHIACAGGRYLTILKIGGAEMTLATFDRRADLFLQRKAMLDEAQKQSIQEIRFITIKRKTPIRVENTHVHPVLKSITDRWNKEFTETYSLAHYAMIVIAAPNDDDAAEQLRRSEDFFLQRMSDYECSVLEEDPSSPADGPLAVIAQFVSPITRPTPLGAGLLGEQISARLTADSIDFGQEQRGLIKFSNGRETIHASVIGIRDSGDKTSENALRDVLSIDADLMIYQVIRPLDSTRQMVELNREKGAAPMMTLSASAGYEYQAALDQLDGQSADNRATIHDYALNIILYHENPEDLFAIENEISSSLSRTGATIIRETITAPAIWFSLFPSTEIWPRKFRMMSTNVAANTPLVKPSTGSRHNEWNPHEPIAYFRSISGEPYGFSFHATDSLTEMPPAHTLIIGPTGRGKSTMVSFLASQALRIPSLKTYLFDRMNGLEVFTKAAGGEYLTFEGDSRNSGMNPLHMPDSPENRSFLRQFIGLLCGAQDASDFAEASRLIDLVYGERDENGLNTVGALDIEDRSLALMYRAAFSAHGRMRGAMQPWVDPALLGNYFNAPQDTLNLEGKRVFGFDMTTALTDEKLAPPLVRYLLQKIYQDSAKNDNPALIFVDETAPLLGNKSFADWFMKVLLQEGRKRRMAVISAFQRPSALQEAGLQDLFMGQCQTVIFLRNPAGQESEYAPWGLTRNEMDFVLNRTYKEHRYLMLVKKIAINETAIVDGSLAKLGDLIKIFSSSKPDVTAYNKCEAKYGPGECVPHYLKGEFAVTQ